MIVHVGGKRWELTRPSRLATRGDCDGPHIPGKQIRIRAGLTGEDELEVILHELLHAADWNASEEWVHNTALDLARILYRRLGYRRDGQEKKT